MNKRTKAGTLVITGTFSKVGWVRLEVGVSDGKGGTRFGGSTSGSVDVAYRDEPEFEVQIGGISAHDTTFGRQRAQAYLKACDIVDSFARVMAQGESLQDAFGIVMRGQGLRVDYFHDDENNITAARAR